MDDILMVLTVASQALHGLAKIEMPPNAEPGTWVAKTLHCNDMVTAIQVTRACNAKTLIDGLLARLSPVAQQSHGEEADSPDARTQVKVLEGRIAEMERERMEGHRAFEDLFGENLRGRDFATKLTMARALVATIHRDRDAAVGERMRAEEVNAGGGSECGRRK